MSTSQLAILLGLLCPLSVAAVESRDSGASDESTLLRTLEVDTPPIRLTKRYASMHGPKSIRSFQLDTDPENTRVWIRRYKIGIVEEGPGDTEFLCHAWLMADSGRPDPESGQRGTRGGRDPSLFLTISQGLEDLHFPEGYAVEFDSRDVSRLGVMTMAVNNNHDEIDREIQFRATIDYLDDPAAQQLGIKPLTGFQLHANQALSVVSSPGGPGSGHEGHSGHGSGGQSAATGQGRTDHWLVPPGRQVLRSDVESGVVRFDGMIHFIKIHLHPYGESVTLIDKTTGEEVWKGLAKNHSERAHLTEIESYSSTTGIPVYRDRNYELVTVYNNPTDEPIDAMAVMRIFVHPLEDGPAS